MMQQTGSSDDRRFGRVVACALLAVALAGCGDDEPDASDAIGDDVTTTTEPDSSATTTPSRDVLADATAFWEAVVAGDRAAAQSYVDPVHEFGSPAPPFGRAETLEGQFDWYEAVGWQWTLEGCVPDDADPGYAECEATAKNAWSEAMGVDPVTGTFVMGFDDDGHIDIVTNTFTPQWVGRAWEPFSAWVSANHPDDLEVMLTDGDVNAEILELYEVNTERFVAAQQES